MTAIPPADTEAEAPAALGRAVAHWWLARAREVSRTWFGGGQAGLFAAVERELPLLDALLDESSRRPDPEKDAALLQSVALLWPHWGATGRVTTTLDRLRSLAGRLTVDPLALASPAVRSAVQDAGWAHAWLALCVDDVADADRGIDLLRRATPAVATAAEAARIAQICGIRELYAGDADRARTLLADALDHHLDAGGDADVFVDLSFLAAADSVSGDQESAFDHCERAIALCDDRGERWIRTYVVWAFALSAWRDGDRHRAFVLALDGIAAAGEIGDAYAGAICLEIAGWYDAIDGDVRRGARLLGAADALREATGLPLHFWGTGEQHDEAAEQGAARLGEALFEREVERGRAAGLAEAAGWLAPPPADHADHADDGVAGGDVAHGAALTPRQREIADLIADGRTNKEIARLLLITVRTVETHVEHLFARLGVSSRAQVAAWSVREAMRRS
ncbi:LuxR C-terminal-related transcriptional regulator [Agromyces bracchium]|uniref:LuxR C-terminal-related transcriptional regulator n=1 Tax=Agromyces bracchium TaxID=88376 RepID=UPI0018ACE1F9|nr:helix-turn-helix transcriptional regulator [Agromyces bracchium]